MPRRCSAIARYKTLQVCLSSVDSGTYYEKVKLSTEMANHKVTQLPVPCMVLGEGPHWLEKEQALLYVDIFSKILRRHFINTGRHQVLVLDDGGKEETVSMVIPVENEPELFIIGLGKTLSIVRWSVSDKDHITAKTTAIQTSDYKFNDAKCDPQGRLWVGTMCPFNDKGEIVEPNNASLYKYDHDLKLTQYVKGVTVSNGITWSLDKKTMYYIDSPTRKVDAFDYDDAQGIISNRRTVFDYEKVGLKDQSPDGMTIDIDGNLWVACFGGRQVICVDPKKGELVKKVAIPSKSVTSVCWGGPNYDVLYVTSGTRKTSEEEIKANPSVVGGTFAVTNLGTKGFPPVNFKANLEKLKAKLTA